MIRAIIADDEPLSRRVVQQLLARHRDVRVVAECIDGQAVREAIARHQPDVMFLDIQMPVASGLQVAQQRDSRAGPLIVFVTAYDQFALPAFDVNAVDYLTKPLTEERFDVAVERVRERMHARSQAADAPSYARHLVSRSGSRDIIIPLDTVDYIEADDVYAAVVADGKRFLVRAPLDALERALDPALFARVHRSYIVRLDRVSEARRDTTGALALVVAGMALPVSRRRRTSVEALLKPLAT